MWKKIPDTFFFGIILGIFTLFTSFLFLRSIRALLVANYGNEYFMEPPKVQLFAILINVILFRLMIVNWKREPTGRGMLFSTVILALTYFILFFKFNMRSF